MSQRVLLLREPLRELRYGHTQSVYPADSLDFTQRQVYTIGVGTYELTGRVRFADNGQTLVDLIKAGSKKTTLTYTPNLSDPGVNYACYLIKPLSPAMLKMDPNTGVEFGDEDVEIVLRKTDQSPFAAVQQNALLFAYRAGDRIQEGTYTRVGSARYALNSSNGYGTLSTATTNLARLHWISSASSKGPRTLPSLLFEDSPLGTRTNLVLQSGNLKATSVWTVSNVTVTSGQADPAGGTKAFKIVDATTSAAGILQEVVTVTVSTKVTYSCFIKPGTNSAHTLLFQSTNNATNFIQTRVTWSSGLPTVSAITGVLVGPAERWMNGFYRIATRTTGSLTTGKYKVVLMPTSNVAAAKGSLIAYGPQAE